MTEPNRCVLHVVTHRRWVADDFADALTDTAVEVRHSLGFDVPDLRPGDAVWAPMEWMAQARRALGDIAETTLPLVDPGPSFLTRMPEHLLGRKIEVAPFSSVTAGAGPDVGFFKPANIKVEHLPAAWCTRDDFVEAARSAGLYNDTLVMFTNTRLDIVEEHRCRVLNSQVATSSPYVIGDDIWYEGMTSGRSEEAQAFADAVLVALAPTMGSPRTFTLDVALTREGRWIALETNPAWSSAQYGADLAAVAECLFAANRIDPVWTWRPDPHLVERVKAQRTLTTDAIRSGRTLDAPDRRRVDAAHRRDS